MIAIGHVWAVTAAALCFAIIGGVTVWLGGFESATGFPLAVSLLHLLLFQLVIFGVAWIFAFILSLIPFGLAVYISLVFSIRGWLYFAICGLLTAALLEPVFISIESGLAPVPDSPLTPLQQWMGVARLLLPCGLAGGVTYWATAVRPKRSNIQGSF